MTIIIMLRGIPGGCIVTLSIRLIQRDYSESGDIWRINASQYGNGDLRPPSPLSSIVSLLFLSLFLSYYPLGSIGHFDQFERNGEFLNSTNSIGVASLNFQSVRRRVSLLLVPKQPTRIRLVRPSLVRQLPTTIASLLLTGPSVIIRVAASVYHHRIGFISTA